MQQPLQLIALHYSPDQRPHRDQLSAAIQRQLLETPAQLQVVRHKCFLYQVRLELSELRDHLLHRRQVEVLVFSQALTPI